MIKALVFISAILVFTYTACEGLECYHCFSNSNSRLREFDSKFQRCNEQNLTASNTMTCPDTKSKCIFEVLESEHTGETQIWRTCSDPKHPPCDKNSVPVGHKMLECTFCETDRCNLHKKKAEQNTFTININGNLTVHIE